MKTIDRSKINQSWAESNLEQVQHCPYCGSIDRELAYKDVQDWSFYCAPGKWSYWDCKQCSALYLNPRPTEASIGEAYAAYYTHSTVSKKSFQQILKQRLRNECLSHWLTTDINPRLHLPKGLGWLLNFFKSRVVEPFGLRELASLPKGMLMDVGCGNGNMVSLATNLGWKTIGLEIDPAAVRAARSQGLNVLEGTFELLDEYRNAFDCIVCSHVLEHVHNPQNMLTKLKDALKYGGTLILSLPNATSTLRYHFGENWRGLEAPRHLSIPSIHQLNENLNDMGFTVKQRKLDYYHTAVESSRIQRRAIKNNDYDIKVGKTIGLDESNNQRYDFIEFICIKNETL